VVKRIFGIKPEGRRPRLRWLEDAENDLQELKGKVLR
jgi:hypothetical protein